MFFATPTWLSSLLDSIQDKPEWVFAFVLLITFLESLAFIGLFVPGWLVLIAAGGLVAQQVWSFQTVVLAMLIGAILGEGLSYWLGSHYQTRIRHWSWLQNHKALIQRSDTFFKHYGVLSLVIGRFVGPLRAILPFTAGVSKMPAHTFWTVNLISALIWAPLYLIPGLLLGASLALPEGGREALLIYLTGLILFSFLFVREKRLMQTKEAHGSMQLHKMKLIINAMIIIMISIIFFISPYGVELKNVLLKVWHILFL